MKRRLAADCAFGLAGLLLATGSISPERVSAAALHPRLLVTATEVPALRAKLADGGDDDRAWALIRSRWPFLRDAPLDSLLGGPLAGSNVVAEIGLLAHLELDGTEARQRAGAMALHLARNAAVDTDDFASSLHLRTLALGYDMAFDPTAPNALAEVRTEILSYLAFMPTHFNYYRYLENPYVSNRGMMVGSSMGLAAIAIWGDVDAADQPLLATALQFAAYLVNKCFDELLASDGAYREGVLYGAWTMRMAIPYIEARRRFDSLDLGTDQRLERIASWLAYEVLPEAGGRTHNRNDSSWLSRPLATNSTYLDWAQTRYGSTLARWTWEHVAGAYGADGGENADRVATSLWNRPLPAVDPGLTLPQSRLFADRGLYFYRSSWKSGASGNEILFSLHADRFRGGHAQEDQGQFTLYAHGERWALDNGPAYPTPLPKDTQAHNLVLVDGRGQHNAGQSIGTDATLSNVLLSPWCDWVRADLASAYATHSPYNDPGVPFPGSDWSWGYDGGNPLQRADRMVMVIKGAEAPSWFLLADDFRKDAATHVYEWLFHTAGGNRIDLTRDPCVIDGNQGRLLLAFAHPRPEQLELSCLPFANGGEDPSTQRLVARATAVEPRFVIALMPLAAATPSPAVLSTQSGDLVALQVQWSWGVEDLATYNGGESLQTSGAIGTDAKASVVRRAGGTIARYAMAEGTRLQWNGGDLIAFDRRASASWSGETLHLSDHDVHFMAYGPGIQRVMGPAGEIYFERSGNWVHDATTSSTEGGRVLTGTWIGTRRAMPVRLACGPAAGNTPVTIHDVRGRLIRGFVVTRETGTELRWDGTDAHGQRVAPGLYLVHSTGCGDLRLRRILLLP